MFTKEKKLEGSMTVMLALCIAIIAALFLSVLESARTQGARLYLSLLTNSAMDSLFSQYHKKLWEDYRLLGLEFYSNEQLKEEFKGFAKPYIEADNFYSMSEPELEISELKLITDDDAELFEDEVLDYMRYGIVAKVLEESFVSELIDSIRDGFSIFDLKSSYDDHSKTAFRLEEKLEEIDELLKEQELLYEEALSFVRVYNGNGAKDKLYDMQDIYKEIPKAVESYKKYADKLMEELKQTKASYDEKRSSGELTESSAAVLYAELEKYESYAAADGGRRAEVESLINSSYEASQNADQVISEIDWALFEEASFVPTEEADSPDYASIWASSIAMLESFPLLSLNLNKGIEDKKTKKGLEAVADLINADLLELLLPSDMEISKASLGLSEPPSQKIYSGRNNSRRGLLDKIFISEYKLEVLNYYGRGIFNENESKKGSGALELEYVLGGKDSDRENLKSFVEDLLALRSGLNLLHILSDAEKREACSQLALAVTGALGFTPIAGIMSFFIMSVWAFGQALRDVKALLNGGKVRLMHIKESFDLELSNLLSLSEKGGVTESKGSESGFSYKDYLRLFLIMSQGSQSEFRCMDMIEKSLKQGQSDFKLDRCIYSLNIESKVNTGHIFSELGLLKGSSKERIKRNYNMMTESSFSY